MNEIDPRVVVDVNASFLAQEVEALAAEDPAALASLADELDARVARLSTPDGLQNCIEELRAVAGLAYATASMLLDPAKAAVHIQAHNELAAVCRRRTQP